MKVCTKCKTEKPITEFHKLRPSKDGLQYRCKACCSVFQRICWEKNKEKRAADYKIYCSENKEQIAARKRAWRLVNLERVKANQKAVRLRHPEKHAARAAARRAIKLGLLKKKPCQRCGSSVVEAHHEDYSKPLDVEFLCMDHHIERHSELGGGLTQP